MQFYCVQIKERHDPGVNIREKVSITSANKAGGSSRGGGAREGALRLLAGILGVRTP